MLYLYYALVKGSNGAMLIAINIIGCAIETTYLIIYMIYAPSQAKMYTARLLILFNLGVYGLIILSTMLFSHGKLRAQVVGWICGVFSVCVFASPLSVMRLVIRTKSAEFLPIWLSFFLTICAVMWFFYGFLIGDFFIALPNVLGFLLGVAQMILYAIYKDARNKEVTPEGKLEELAIEIKLGGVIDIVHEDHQANKEAAQKIIAEQDGRNESSDV
ncbi:hypothetical protein Nepgr_027856 [Nepenthes gracilis]|uniref:Bidirectional sugar transporter SWEET n=1 Tax=Nepenthes gracilis TaxID=150966 RepID=A0AAD3T9H9_NEPGR|nr:hypothetical protein Nepgr_027856 [Nepenthes gracilis]